MTTITTAGDDGHLQGGVSHTKAGEIATRFTTAFGVLAYTTYSQPRADDVNVIKITAKKFKQDVKDLG